MANWISVEDRLPEGFGRFWIFDEDGDVDTAYFDLRWYYDPDGDTLPFNVTHWMAIDVPKAPEA